MGSNVVAVFMVKRTQRDNVLRMMSVVCHLASDKVMATRIGLVAYLAGQTGIILSHLCVRLSPPVGRLLVLLAVFQGCLGSFLFLAFQCLVQTLTSPST